MTAILATQASTNREVALTTQKVIFITGGVALLLVGSTLISVTGPAAVVQAFIQAGTAAAFTTGAAGGAAAATATAPPAVASALASGTLLVKQILLGATVTVSTIVWLLYSCLFPGKDIDNDNKNEHQASQLSWDLREFLMEIVYCLRLCSRPSSITPSTPSSPIADPQLPFSYSATSLPLLPPIGDSFAQKDCLLPQETTTEFITELLENLGLGSYEDYNASCSTSSSICSSSSIVTSSSASISSRSSADTVWYTDGTSVAVDQNLTTVAAVYIDRPPPPPPSSSSSSSSSSSTPSSSTPSVLRQRFNF